GKSFAKSIAWVFPVAHSIPSPSTILVHSSRWPDIVACRGKRRIWHYSGQCHYSIHRVHVHVLRLRQDILMRHCIGTSTFQVAPLSGHLPYHMYVLRTLFAY
ncbi:unnamed protein product, partial [Ectocarpus sp. 4 AP-2014]